MSPLADAKPMAAMPITDIAMRETVTCRIGSIVRPKDPGRSRDTMLPASDRNKLEVDNAAARTAGYTKSWAARPR